MTPPTPPAVRAAAEVYADQKVPRCLPCDPLEHVVDRTEFRKRLAEAFAAGAAWAFAEAARIAEEAGGDYGISVDPAKVAAAIRAAAGPAGG